MYPCCGSERFLVSNVSDDSGAGACKRVSRAFQRGRGAMRPFLEYFSGASNLNELDWLGLEKYVCNNFVILSEYFVYHILQLRSKSPEKPYDGPTRIT
jgi:hypothetical protein